jgi:allantoin racemase
MQSPLRILVQHIWPNPAQDSLLGDGMRVVYQCQEELMRRVIDGEVHIVQSFNPASAYYTNCASMEAYNNVGMLEGLRRADAEDFDVAFITCGNDPAVEAARDLLHTPVVSATESAMLIACTLGRRFGCVTFDEESTVLVDRNIRAFGLEHRALPFNPARSAGFHEGCQRWFEDAGYLRDVVIPRFEQVAKGLIADGADVIIGACGNFAALPYHGYAKVTGTQVPVLDAVASGAQMAALVGRQRRALGISTSKQRGFKGVSRDIAGQVLAPFARMWDEADAGSVSR